MTRGRLAMTAAAIAVIGAALAFATSATAAPRPGAGPCREAVNGLVSMLDAKTDDSAAYRDTYAVVTQTCGPIAPAPKPVTPPPERAACSDLAASMVDIIEDDKMNTVAFVTARDKFAVACGPR